MSQNILITGATSGIGKETALELARQGHQILFNSRDPKRGESVRQELIKASGNQQIHMIPADLTSFAEIRSFAKAANEIMPQIDILINNAGLYASERRVTVDGFEEMLGVNHLAPFLLTGLLLENVKKSPAGRIITVSSALHKRGNVHFGDMNAEQEYSAMGRYGDSKLMNVLFTRELARKLADTPIAANSLHPGVVGTNFGRELPQWMQTVMGWFALSPAKGAQTTIYLATSPEGGKLRGEYFAKSKVASTSDAAKDAKLAAELWQWSEKATGIKY